MERKKIQEVVIQEFEAPSIYKVKFEGSTGYDIMTYKIESLEDEKITVRYSEDFISEFTVEGKSSKMMEKLNNKRAQRRAKKLLKNIEAYIKINRIQKIYKKKWSNRLHLCFMIE